MTWATQGGSGYGPIVTPGGGGVDPTQPASPLDTGYMFGLATNWLSATTVNIEPGRTRNVADDFDLTLAATTVINFAINGAGGLDTGVLVANTWYYGWVIGDSTGANPTTVIGSAASTFAGLTPNLPAGYDRGRRVASYRCNPVAAIREFYQQTRSGLTRRFAWDVQTFANMQVLGGFSGVAWTNVSCAGFMPPTTNMVWLNTRGDSSSLVDSKVYFRPDTTTVAADPVTQQEMYGGDSGYIWQRTVASIFEIMCGSALTSIDVCVLGYDDWLFQ